MNEKQLISAIRELKEIKPRQEWVYLVKSQILVENGVSLENGVSSGFFAKKPELTPFSKLTPFSTKICDLTK